MGFLKGVVEGFYGRQWSWQDRHHCVDFLAGRGLNSYLYCPKGDPCLRRQWQQEWPAATRLALQSFGEHCATSGIDWGVGLSPFALYRDYDAPQRRALRARLASIDALGGSLLAVLFDDMPGDCPDLARRQAEIVNDIAAWRPGGELLVCPTYYSFDPQLERHFGARPASYWQELGALLPASAHIFWTGNEVCSPQISRADLSRAAAELGRAPLLWDNYPVNDGKKACNYINLRPLPDREHNPGELLSGHLCNPMNQARLSCYPLAGLAALYGGAPPAWQDHYEADLCALLQRDRSLFQERGLASIAETDRATLVQEYAALTDPAAAEVTAWLRGEYRFDPTCLTD